MVRRDTPPKKTLGDHILWKVWDQDENYLKFRPYGDEKLLGFSFTSTGATAQDLVSEAVVTGFGGAQKINAIHLKLTGDDAYLGLGKAATKTPGEDIVPLFTGAYFNEDNVDYSYISIIRDGSTNITAKGYVVVK